MSDDRSVDKLELHIQRELVEFLRTRGWHVEKMLANSYQMGIPDLYCYHKKWGERWVEVKRPKDYSFTKRQRQKWPEWEKAGIPLWILTAATQEQYDLLFKPPNWREFWKPSFQLPTRRDVDAMLDALDREDEREQELAGKDERHSFAWHENDRAMSNVDADAHNQPQSSSIHAKGR
jgi:hypothetical protein